MSRTVKMRRMFTREGLRPMLAAFEGGVHVATWPADAEGFLSAFAFMWTARPQRQVAESIEVALDDLVNGPAVLGGAR